jgi:hypothetical protein
MPTKASLHGTTPGEGRNTVALMLNRTTKVAANPTDHHPRRVLGSETIIVQLLFSSCAALDPSASSLVRYENFCEQEQNDEESGS